MLKCRHFCQEYLIFHGRWSLKTGFTVHNVLVSIRLLDTAELIK